MASGKEIVPWTCHVCDEEFNIDSGGLCSKCHKATCLNCLGLNTFFGTVFGKRKKERIKNAVCRSCADQQEDKIEKKPL